MIKNFLGTLKQTYYTLSFSSFPTVYVHVCVKELSKLERSRSTPVEAPLSHRKQCSWNTSSVVPPQFCGFVTSNYIMESHICLISALLLVWHVRIDLAHQLCCCQWCWVSMCGLTNQSRLGIWQERQEPQPSVSDREAIQWFSNGQFEKTMYFFFFFFLAIKHRAPILVVTWNKNMNLKMSVTCVMYRTILIRYCFSFMITLCSQNCWYLRIWRKFLWQGTKGQEIQWSNEHLNHIM